MVVGRKEACGEECPLNSLLSDSVRLHYYCYWRGMVT